MTAEVLMKGFWTLMFSALFVWIIYDRDSASGVYGRRRRYLPYISGGLLQGYMLGDLICAFIFADAEIVMGKILSFVFGMFFHICLYYLLLIPALPFLRRNISARACAMLWMLPGYLYLTQMRYMRLPRPYWVIEAPFILVRILLAVWLIGFLTVLCWKILSHLTFRARILRDASPVTDQAVLAAWHREAEAARFRKPKFKPVVSPCIRTPLSVGLFPWSIRVVLPERDYTSEELAFIFRHELIHIDRGDSGNKFFLVFCSAMCWFNPLMRMAVRRSFEDLELSCDETVLLDADDDARRRYADLLLKVAGDERGFTTCLSASASALRYRLKSVVVRKEKSSGVLAVGLVFFLLCMSCGYVALTYKESTGAEMIFRSKPPEQHVLLNSKWDDRIFIDETALCRYLSGLPMNPLSGNYSLDGEEASLSLLFDTPEGGLEVTLSDKFIELVPLHDQADARYCYLPEGTDWDALRECTIECPVLNVHVTGADDGRDGDFEASLSHISLMEGNGNEVLYEMDAYGVNGIFGYPADQASFSFNLSLNGDCAVEIIPLNGGNRHTVFLNGRSMALSLPKEPCRYIVRGAFNGRDGRLYQVEFQFEIGDL